MRPFSGSKRYYRQVTFALLLALVLSGCMTYNGSRRTYLERMARYLPEPERPVIIIPGFGNSRLYDPDTGKPVWGHPKTLVHTKYEDDLDLPVDPDTNTFGFDRLVPDGGFAGSRAPFNIAFTLSHALQEFGHYRTATEDTGASGTVYAFAYDWRLSATTNARRLDEYIDSIRVRYGVDPPKVDIVAHSAGGIVALAYLKLGGLGPESSPHAIESASRAAAAKVSSLTLLGVPQWGTNEAVRALARGDKLVRRELPPAMMATFPSVPEMLPEDGTIFIDETGRRIELDVWDVSTWRQLGFAVWSEDSAPEARQAFERSLRRARALRNLLERPFPAGVREIAIAGDCVPTASRVLLRKDNTLAFYPAELSPGESALGTLMFGPGDGSIESRSALGPVDSRFVFCAGHHGIASDPNVHRTVIRELLTKGRDAESTRGATAQLTGTSSMETPNPR